MVASRLIGPLAFVFLVAPALVLAAGCGDSNGGPPHIDAQPTTLPNGLQIYIVREGSGEAAQAGQMITVDYTGWLEDGKKFDSSIDRGRPYPFQLGTGNVIQGWDEGVVGMKIGEQRRLVIPPGLAYGPGGGGGIPGNATLTFDIDLLAIQ